VMEVRNQVMEVQIQVMEVQNQVKWGERLVMLADSFSQGVV
jgi:hypothetical protein